MTSFKPDLFSAADLSHWFDEKLLAQAKQDLTENRVNNITHPTPSRINAAVRGESRTDYLVSIEIVNKKGKVEFINQCSCDMAANCHHVGATLLAALALSKSTSSNIALSSTTSGAHWLSFLSDAKKNPRETKVHKHALVYILTVMEIAGDEVCLYVELKIVNILKNNSFGAEKVFYAHKKDHAAALNADDELIIHHLQKMQKNIHGELFYYSGNSYIIRGPETTNILKSMIGTQRCYWEGTYNPTLSFDGSKKGEFVWEFVGDKNQRLKFFIADHIVLPTNPLFYVNQPLDGDDIYKIGLATSPFDAQKTIELVQSPELSPTEATNLRVQIEQDDNHPLKGLPLPKNWVKTVKRGTPIPYLRLEKNIREKKDSGIAIVKFQYDGVLVDIGSAARTVEYSVEDSIFSLKRNMSKEKTLLSSFHKMQVEAMYYNKSTFVIGLPFMFEDLPVLEKNGWIIDVADDFPLACVKEDDWYTEVDDQTQYDWFGFELGIFIDGEKINVLPLLVKLISENPQHLDKDHLEQLEDTHPFHLQLPDKRYVMVEAKRIKAILFVLVELYDGSVLKNDKMRVSYVQAAQLLGLQQSLQARWMGGQKLKNLGEKLTDFKGIIPCEMPKSFQGELRPYQKEGVDWLNFLREFQLGGVLADDMGLGKTVQVLTHLLAEKESGRQKHPNLIIAPTSLMNNWQSECQRFTPALTMLILQGNKRHVHFENIQSVDIILSTYPLINRDKEILLTHQFHYLILDEAQYIKNPHTKAYQSLLLFKVKHALCMTGTPMENHLGELWSLFHFAVPGLLSDNKSFKKLFRDPIEKNGDVVRQKSLANRVRPFMLRRTKEQVATELPAKTEIIHHIEISGTQLDLYESIRLAMQAKVMQAVQEKGLMRSQIIILDALLKLRQTCNDPRLLPFERAKSIHSAKLECLLEMLDTLIEEGRKILIFSSFTSMLAFIEEALIARNIMYVKLTGQTKDRVTPIHTFQNENIPIMLLSLKAGGVGLNLTAADTVIHYDPWWNPAAEAQATDRAYRIGQMKPVFVYKLVCKGTVEEKILKMQENKKQLLKGIFKEGSEQSAALTSKDLEYLFESM